MKKGTELVCIKDYSYEVRENVDTRSFSIGRIYKILSLDKNGTSVYIEADLIEERDTNNGLRFSLMGDTLNTRYLYDYFITLAEWRDSQIDKILDNGNIL